MKQFLVLLTIFCSINLNAQNYLISFTGTGESTTVSTVKVENLNKGTSLTLNGSDVLQLTLVTNVAIVENRGSSRIMIYPNPMTDHTTLVIYPSESGDAAISIYDMTGKLIAQKQFYLDKISNEFILSGFNSGLYLISVRGKAYQYSEKLICQNETNESIHIDKVINRQSFDTDIYNKVSKGTLTTVDMGFSEGDRFKFTGISGNYSTVLIDIPSSDKTIIFNFMTCSDGDNNNYPVVTINNHVWMAENLKTTKYSDGTDIPHISSNAGWDGLYSNSKAYCWYNDDINNKEKYGALYTWTAAMNGMVTSELKPSGVQGACPTGWHLPSWPEFSELLTYLGGDLIAGGKLKETGIIHWQSPNSGASNESGFTGLPGGERNNFGVCTTVTSIGSWWTSTEFSITKAYMFYCSYELAYFSQLADYKEVGNSVRCLKNY